MRRVRTWIDLAIWGLGFTFDWSDRLIFIEVGPVLIQIDFASRDYNVFDKRPNL